MTRRRGPSALNTKPARTSFIATPETARAFLLGEGGLSEAQVEFARQARDLATDIRTLLTAFVRQFSRGASPEPIKEFVLRIPPALQGQLIVDVYLGDLIRLARALTDAQRSPASMTEFWMWAEKKRHWALTTLVRFLKHQRKLEAGIITTLAKMAGLPPLRERHLAALAVLPPEHLEPPQPNPRLVKSRNMDWRYALQQRGEVHRVLDEFTGLLPPYASQ